MAELRSQQAIDALQERFASFFDAVLVEVCLRLPRSVANRQATLRLIAEDATGSWVSVVFTITRVSEFKFVEGPSSNLVLSDGLGIHLIDDGIFVDLAPYTDHPVDPGELRRSHQYVVGDVCSFEVMELRE